MNVYGGETATTDNSSGGSGGAWGNWSLGAAEENATEEPYRPYRVEWTGEILYRIVTTILVMVVTLAGNTILIFMILCHRKQRRKRVNIFLVNLAIGDLMVCLFTMTTEILFVAFGEWVMGAVACKVVVYGQIVTLASATFLLTGMAIDRYQVIVQPLQSFAGHPKIWRKVLIAWVLAFIFAAPQMLIFVQTDEEVLPNGRVRHLCRSQGYTAKWQRKLYFTFLATYILLVPTIIMSYCYLNIIKVVWKRSDSKSAQPKRRVKFPFLRRRTSNENNRINGHLDRPERYLKRRSAVTQNKLSIPKKLVSSSKRNVVKMTLSVIIGFLFCWTPYFVVSLVRIYSDYSIKLKAGLAVAEIMALVHSAMNPILYGIFSTKALKAALARMCRCTQPGRTLDRIDEGMSEEETTWTEIRIGTVPVEGSHGNCCKQVWVTLWYKVKGEPRGQGRNRRSSYYLELVPNGSLAAAQRRKSTQSQILETDLSDNDQPVESLRHLQLPSSSHQLPHQRASSTLVIGNQRRNLEMVEYVSSSN